MKTNRNYKDIHMQVVSLEHFGNDLTLLQLKSEAPLPPVAPGQFVNILPPPSAGTLLRRPISVCDVDAEVGKLLILVKNLGRGSGAICHSRIGDQLEVLIPLGHGFTDSFAAGTNVLLIGGGVGIAPLLYLGRKLNEKGVKVEYLLGGRSAADIPMQQFFSQYGTLHIATEDGSQGELGFVTNHSRCSGTADFIACCGPLPMMKAVTSIAQAKGVECEVSLENKMACGIGACLCCVEDTKDGNVCTCTCGPVFNIKQLKW